MSSNTKTSQVKRNAHSQSLSKSQPTSTRNKKSTQTTTNNKTPRAKNYEIEKLLDIKTVRGVVKYKVKWLGYSEKHCTWEPANHISRPIVEAFEKRYKLNNAKEHSPRGTTNSTKSKSQQPKSKNNADSYLEKRRQPQKQTKFEVSKHKKKKVHLSPSQKSSNRRTSPHNSKTSQEEDDYDDDADVSSQVSSPNYQNRRPAKGKKGGRKRYESESIESPGSFLEEREDDDEEEEELDANERKKKVIQQQIDRRQKKKKNHTIKNRKKRRNSQSASNSERRSVESNSVDTNSPKLIERDSVESMDSEHQQKNKLHPGRNKKQEEGSSIEASEHINPSLNKKSKIIIEEEEKDAPKENRFLNLKERSEKLQSQLLQTKKNQHSSKKDHSLDGDGDDDSVIDVTPSKSDISHSQIYDEKDYTSDDEKSHDDDIEYFKIDSPPLIDEQIGDGDEEKISDDDGDEEIDLDSLPDYGHFRFGDIPDKIKFVDKKGSMIIFTLTWKERKNGKKPLKTQMTNLEVRSFDHNLLLDFYEARLKAPKKKRKYTKRAEKSPKRLKDIKTDKNSFILASLEPQEPSQQAKAYLSKSQDDDEDMDVKEFAKGKKSEEKQVKYDQDLSNRSRADSDAASGYGKDRIAILLQESMGRKSQNQSFSQSPKQKKEKKQLQHEQKVQEQEYPKVIITKPYGEQNENISLKHDEREDESFAEEDKGSKSDSNEIAQEDQNEVINLESPKEIDEDDGNKVQDLNSPPILDEDDGQLVNKSGEIDIIQEDLVNEDSSREQEKDQELNQIIEDEHQPKISNSHEQVLNQESQIVSKLEEELEEIIQVDPTQQQKEDKIIAEEVEEQFHLNTEEQKAEVQEEIQEEIQEGTKEQNQGEEKEQSQQENKEQNQENQQQEQEISEKGVIQINSDSKNSNQEIIEESKEIQSQEQQEVIEIQEEVNYEPKEVTQNLMEASNSVLDQGLITPNNSPLKNSQEQVKEQDPAKQQQQENNPGIIKLIQTTVNEETNIKEENKQSQDSTKQISQKSNEEETVQIHQNENDNEIIAEISLPQTDEEQAIFHLNQLKQMIFMNEKQKIPGEGQKQPNDPREKQSQPKQQPLTSSKQQNSQSQETHNDQPINQNSQKNQDKSFQHDETMLSPELEEEFTREYDHPPHENNNALMVQNNEETNKESENFVCSQETLIVPSLGMTESKEFETPTKSIKQRQMHSGKTIEEVDDEFESPKEFQNTPDQ